MNLFLGKVVYQKVLEAIMQFTNHRVEITVNPRMGGGRGSVSDEMERQQAFILVSIVD